MFKIHRMWDTLTRGTVDRNVTLIAGLKIVLHQECAAG